ncbi:hypothetical protein LE270_03290 [Salmonella enterica subsp. enterica serovar Hillegersberg]|uniref:hypothetical protein n=1 Tax=Salmonella enterica TaxID=28901 RepID=UPI0012C25753|nr:hypothetical protein [Salmonella enterica]ECA8970981.1 hypothetical protein [Salmonella enterica subsp. enterica serovar Omuna]MCB7131096.1 hypothetical protein [Salmonella enterica subsp. enterica serovar Hillegersberg]
MAILVQCRRLLLNLALCVFLTVPFAYLAIAKDDTALYGIATAMAGLAGTLLGFLITGVALLTAVMDRTLLTNMRKTGHYQRFIKGIFLTSWLFLVQIILLVICLFLSGKFLYYMFCSTMFVAACSYFGLFRNGVRFYNVIATMD